MRVPGKIKEKIYKAVLKIYSTDDGRFKQFCSFHIEDFIADFNKMSAYFNYDVRISSYLDLLNDNATILKFVEILYSEINENQKKLAEFLDLEKSINEFKRNKPEATVIDKAEKESEFDRLRKIIKSDKKFSIFLISLLIAALIFSTVLYISNSDSYKILSLALIIINFPLCILFFLQFRTFDAKIVAHDIHVKRYSLAPPPPEEEIEDKIITNAKFKLL